MVEVQVNTVSIAGKTTESRSGAGRVRHVEVRRLWIQDRVAKEELDVIRVKGESNVADIFTKRVDRNSLDQHMKAIGVVRRCGRHELCPELGDVKESTIWRFV